MKIVEGVDISGYGYQELAQEIKMCCNISSVVRDHRKAANQVRVEIGMNS